MVNDHQNFPPKNNLNPETGLIMFSLARATKRINQNDLFRLLNKRQFGSEQKQLVSFGTNWEQVSACSRAVRIGNTVHVSGTCAPGDTPTEQVSNDLLGMCGI